MKRQLLYVLILLLLYIQVVVCAQDLTIKSFKLVESDITAKMESRNDINGDPCALIKVHIPDEIVKVEGAYVEPITTVGIEKWIYVPTASGTGASKIILYTARHKPLNVTYSKYVSKTLLPKTTYSLDIEEPSSANKISFEVEGVKFNMIKVIGGTFMMGATAEQNTDARKNEIPIHSVTLSDYYIGETEVTQDLWYRVMGNNPSYDQHMALQPPAESVSWYDCQAFISKLNNLTGKIFSLPTEAQWEYAARGGKNTKNYKYSGENKIKKVAWFGSNSEGIRMVATKIPNELGLYDMSGNVWEWCNDWYGEYDGSSQTNPSGAYSGTRRVFRGGSWCNEEQSCRVSFRGGDVPSVRNKYIGLRLVLLSP